MGLMQLFMGVWGWWAFDIFTLICSYLAIEVISAQTVMRTLGLLTFMVPIGFSLASGILIGENIGNDNKRAIKHYYKVAMSLGLISGII